MRARFRRIALGITTPLVTLALTFIPSALLAQEETQKSTEAAKQGGLPPWDEILDAIINLNVGNIPLWRLLAALALIGLGFAMRKFLLDKMMSPIRKLLDRTETEYDDQLLEAIQHPLRWLVNLVALYFALLVLSLPTTLMTVASLLLQTVGTVMVAWMLNKLVDVLIAVLGDFAEDTESEVDDYLVPVVGRVLRVALIALVCILIIQQWGYDVTSLLAGLGLGGLAFALAAKPTLANWFGSIMIFTDRPFTVGDRIDIDAGEGVVEEVGLRSTRVRTREDSLITIPNADMASKPIDNLSERRRRRIKTTIGVVYSTSSDQMHGIVDELRAVLEEHPDIDASEAIVRFVNFGDSALEIFVDCYAETTSRAEYYRIREDVHFRFTEVVEEAGSSFAFPSRSVYMEQSNVDGE